MASATTITSSSAIFSAAFVPPRTVPFVSRPSLVSLAPAKDKDGAAAPGRLRAVASSPAGKERQPRGIMMPRRVTPEMAEFVGATEISRTQALKLIWAHIKEHNLQDPDNKRIIICDEKLKRIFAGKDRVGFLEIAGLISPHFLK